MHLTCSHRQDENLLVIAPLTETNCEFWGLVLYDERQKFANWVRLCGAPPQRQGREQAEAVSRFAG